MADINFWALNEKLTPIVSGDETLIIDSEAWNEVKRIKSTQYKWDIWNTWPQWPAWPTGSPWPAWSDWSNWTDWADWADWIDWVGSQWPQGIQWLPWDDWADWADWTWLDWKWAYWSWVAYSVDDWVSYQGNSYIAIQGSTGQTPDSSPTYWSVLATKWVDWTNGTNWTNWIDWTDWTDWVVQSLVAWTNIEIDSSTPANPIVSSTKTTINTQTWTTYTLVLTDKGKSILANNASAQTYTIPTNASVAFAIWTTLIVTQYWAWAVTLNWDIWVTVNWVSAWWVSTTSQYWTLALEKIWTNEWLILWWAWDKLINAQTWTTYTIVLSDNIDTTQLVTLSNAWAIALTIPTNATTPFPIWTQIDIAQQWAGAVTISGAWVTINSKWASLTTNWQFVWASLVKIGTNEWNVFWDLV